MEVQGGGGGGGEEGMDVAFPSGFLPVVWKWFDIRTCGVQ